ncbi:MAG: class I SAM-dependent methyltransferase [Solirubrobacterales bacterium]
MARAASLARRAASTRAGRAVTAALREEGSGAAADPPLDGWLQSFYGERLGEIDVACAGAGPEAYELFRDLDDDLWAMLLSRNYSSFPNILALLPEVPEAHLQQSWNGASGLALLSQSKAFYRHARGVYALHGPGELSEATVLDFGCGWGRLTRFFARDIAPGALLGCDPVEEILDVCRRGRLPAELHLSEFTPATLPFERKLDLAFSFSVFTHISEATHLASLEAIYSALNPGGLLIVTIRPPAYLELDPKLHATLAELGPDAAAALREPRYLFVPHAADPLHPQYDGEEMTYGETVITLPYVRERWSPMFELLDARVCVEDPYQVALTLRRRD